MIALRTSIPAAALIIGASQAPASAQPAQNAVPQQVQCRWETPASFDPKVPARAPAWTCAAATPSSHRCGHYELYLPIWAIGRALPPVRTWVSEPCQEGSRVPA